MHLHLSWHATRQLTLSIGCLAGALTQTGCRPKYICDHHGAVGGGDDDEAPEVEVAQPERETATERPSAPGQPYALPRPIVRPLIIEEEPVEVAQAQPAAEAETQAAEAETQAAEASRRHRQAQRPAAEPAQADEPEQGVVIYEAEPEAAEEPAVAAPTEERPRPAASRRRSRRDDRAGDPAIESLGHAVAPSRGLGSGSSYGLSLTGGIGSY